MPVSFTVARGCASWSEPDAVFAELFTAPETAGPTSSGVCTCPACQAAEEPGSLPAMRPLAEEALAAAAAASPLVRRACALARWVGPGRALTPSKVLRPAEAATAVADLELDQPVLPGGGSADSRPFGRGIGRRGPRTRSAKHLPELHPIWAAAVAAGLIEIRGQKAVPGPALTVWPQVATDSPVALPAAVGKPVSAGIVLADPGSDHADIHRQLDCWALLVAGYLRAQAELEMADEHWFAGPGQLLLPISAVLLYTADDTPLTPSTLALGSLIADQDDDGLDPMALLTLPEQIARWTEILQMWAMAGAVARPGSTRDDDAEDDVLASEAADELAEQWEPLVEELRQVFPGGAPFLDPVLEALRDGPVITVTPGGRDLLARVLRGQGFTVPTVGDLAQSPPEDFLLGLSGHDPEAAAEEIRIWLDARGEGWQVALEELVASASGQDEEGPLRRVALPIVIALTAESAGSLLARWQEDPWLAAPVALGLAAASRAPQPPAGSLLWMAVDMLSTSLDDADAFADLADVTGIADLLAEPGAVTVAVGVEHPQAREVLQLLAGNLENRALARQLLRAIAADKPRRAPRARRSTARLRGL